MAKIGSAPSGENSSLAGTEKVPLTGSQWAYISTIASYIRTLTQTLTNKTINLAANTLTGTTAEFNTALSDGNFATQAGTETLTNKTVNLTSNTLTGTISQFNTALSDGDFATLAGSETLSNKTIAAPTITGAITLPDDVRQTFNPGTNNAGLNVGALAGDPSTPSNGDIWYDSTAGELTARIAGTNVALGAGGGGSVATDSIWDAKGDLAVGTGANTAAKLTVGTNGQVLVADSAEVTGLKWTSAAGTGDVVGPASATDNAITRFDSTTGKLVQNSSATVDDNGTINIPTGQTYNINGSTIVDDTAYDATSWNGDTTHAPSKNAVRDKIESMTASVWTQVVSEDGTSFTNFTAGAGSWSSDGTVIKNTDTATNRRAKYNTQIVTGGIIFEAEIQIRTAGADRCAGLIIGFDGSSGQGMLVRLNESDNVNFETDGLTNQLTVSLTINQNTWYKLRLIAFGEVVTAYVDGTIIGSARAGTLGNARYIGLYTTNAEGWFRNIKAWNLDGIPA